MKSVYSVLFTSILLASALTTNAAPRSKQTYVAPPLQTTEEFAKLKPGDSVGMVCTECSSVTVLTIESTDQAMDLCKEGEEITCGSCKMKSKVVRHGPRSKSGSHTEVSYVNEAGEECMFMVKLKS